MICALVLGPCFWLKNVRNRAATCVFVLFVRLFGLFGPNRYEKLLASQFPRFVAFGPPLSDLISAWPFLFCQYPIVAVSPRTSGGGGGGNAGVTWKDDVNGLPFETGDVYELGPMTVSPGGV